MPHPHADDEAVIRIRAHCRGGRLSSSSLRLPAGIAPAPALIGLAADEAVATLAARATHSPRAHACALRLACDAALGLPPPDQAQQLATERALAAEAADAHLQRLLVDWPPCFGFDARHSRFAEFHRRLVADADAATSFALGGEVLDLVARELLAGFFNRIRLPHGLADFIERANAGGALGSVLVEMIGIGASEAPAGGSVQLLGTLSAAAWAAAVGDWPSADFIATPTFAGAPAETGPLARHAQAALVRLLLDRGHRISARLFAKAIDLADCASRMRYPLTDDLPPLVDAASPAPGTGVARIETARGVVLLWLRLVEGRVADCVIVPPLAWNFHPQGAFIREGSGWAARGREAALRRLNLLALALDPSLPYRIELIDEDDAGAATGAAGS